MLILGGILSYYSAEVRPEIGQKNENSYNIVVMGQNL